MKEHYEKEINRLTDIERKVSCVNLSMGAENQTDFAWIANNLDVFKRKCIETYSNIFAAIVQEPLKLYFVSEVDGRVSLLLDGLTVETLAALKSGIFAFAESEIKIRESLANLSQKKGVFEKLYGAGFLLAAFRDFWSEGNALVFYSSNEEVLDKITRIAQNENFVLREQG